MKYTSISKALYDYTAQSDEELTFKEDDTLYILDKDEDPDWWKAQLKAPSLDRVGPIGLVPANYVHEAEPIAKVEGLYDYIAQQEEELSFKEDDIMILYENDDPDWLLVKDKSGGIGLVPRNYVQEVSHQAEPAAATNPTSSPTQQLSVPLSSTISTHSDTTNSWQVHEYDTEKKKKTKGKGSLLIGNGMLCYGSETDKASPVRRFSILEVSHYSLDNKNVHIEVSDASRTVFDFQAMSKSEATAIILKIEESQSLANTKAPQQQSTYNPAITNHAVSVDPEHESELASAAPGCEPRWAIALYAFDPEGTEEISMKENDQVLVVDYVSSQDWWTIEYQDGRSGIVPAAYVKFQEYYEVDLEQDNEQLQKEEEEADRRWIEVEVSAARQRRLEEEKQQCRREEDERTRKTEAEARPREMEAKRSEQAMRPQPAAVAAGSASPRRSQIPAPPPPVKPAGSNHAMPSTPEVKSIPVPNNRSLPERPKQAQDPGKPDPSKVRTWTDRTGAFKVEAQFVGCNNDKIRLHKINGVKIDVPMMKMCMEDLRYIEQETGQQLLEDNGDDAPLPPLSSKSSRNKQGWDWCEYFMKANVPMHNSLRYASAFQAEGLGEHDLDSLTHRKMKSLGMSETHVQRLQRFIETGASEPASDEEVPLSRKIKKKVSFGVTSIIDDSDDESVGPMGGRMMSQVQDDERYARQLQEEYNQQAQAQAYSQSRPGAQQHSLPHGHDAGLQRRGTGRPTPSNAAPRGINTAMMDKIKNQLSSEPLKPSPAAPPPPPRNNTLPTVTATVSVAQPVKTHSTGFTDDAWTPCASGSPSTTSAQTDTVAQTKAAWSAPLPAPVPPQLLTVLPVQSIAGAIQPVQRALVLTPNPPPQQPAIPLPPCQRPTPAVPQQLNKVDPQMLSQWTTPAGNQPQGQPQPQLQTLPFQQQQVPQQQPPPIPLRSPVNQFVAVQSQFMQSPSTQTTSFSSQAVPVQQPGIPQQSPMNRFTPVQPQIMQPTGSQNLAFASAPVQQRQFMQQQQQQSPMVQQVPLNTALPPALVPSNVGLQPQLTGQSISSTTSSRSWASATPDNPFGRASTQQHHPPQQQGSLTGASSLQPTQVFGVMVNNGVGSFQAPQPTGFSQTPMAAPITDPNDRYSAFKTVNVSSPGVFNPSQQQQGMMPFQHPQSTGFVPMQQQHQQQQQQQPFGNQQQFYNRW